MLTGSGSQGGFDRDGACDWGVLTGSGSQGGFDREGACHWGVLTGSGWFWVTRSV